MTIDVGALRKFQDLFGPAIEAIPAVIEAVERKADMDREVAAHRAKMDKAQAEIQKAYDAADVRLNQFNADISALQVQKTELEVSIRDAKREAAEAARTAKAKAEADLDAVIRAVEQTKAVLAGVEAQVAARTAAAEAEHKVAVAAMQDEIAQLDKRRKTAEAALETLRAKLG